MQTSLVKRQKTPLTYLARYFGECPCRDPVLIVEKASGRRGAPAGLHVRRKRDRRPARFPLRRRPPAPRLELGWWQ